MTNSSDNHNEYYLQRRYSVPDSTSLQASIIENTINLEQEAVAEGSMDKMGEYDFLSKLTNLLRLPMPKFKSIAALGIVGLALILVFNNETAIETRPPGMEIVQDQQRFVEGPETPLMNELDWQEMLLLQDELAFASL